MLNQALYVQKVLCGMDPVYCWELQHSACLLAALITMQGSLTCTDKLGSAASLGGLFSLVSVQALL